MAEQSNLERARAALRRQDFQSAIGHFESYLLAHPRDLETLLELGITYLLGGNQDGFLKSHQEAAQRQAEITRSRRLSRLWSAHERFAARFAHAAAVLSMVSLPMVACQSETPKKTQTKTSASTAEPAADVVESAPEAPRPAATAETDVVEAPQNTAAETDVVEAPTDAEDGGLAAADAVDADAAEIEPVVIKPDNRPRMKYGIRRPKPNRPKAKMKYGVMRPDDL